MPGRSSHSASRARSSGLSSSKSGLGAAKYVQLQAVLEMAEAPIDELIPRVYSAVQTFAEGAPQDDDVTAVVIRRSCDPKRS